MDWDSAQNILVAAGAAAGAMAAIYALWKTVLWPWFSPKLVWVSTITQIRTRLDEAGMERKKIRETLKELRVALERTNRRWEAARAAMGDCFFESDAHGQLIFATPAFFSTVGMAKEHALGDGWLSSILQEDRDTVLREWTHSHRRARPFIMEFRIDGEGEDQSAVTWFAKGVPIFVDGQFAGLVGNMTRMILPTSPVSHGDHHSSLQRDPPAPR